MKKLLTLALTTTLLLSNDDINIEDDFLQSLEEVSEIATKTKLNIDDSPSFVTVLHSNQLQKLGVENVFEALGQVPGVQLKKEPSGVPVVIFRGVSQKSEVKLMIDGVTINNAYRGSIYYYFDFPIELVDRIEVIRGAGSVLYGSGAISGVVNIITKNATNSTKDTVFISDGTNDNYKAGTVVSTKISNIDLSIDAYYHNNSNFIDSIDRHLKDYSIGLNAKYDKYNLIARVKTSDIGTAYGFLDIEDRDKDNFQNKNQSIFAQLSYKNNIYKETSLELLAGINRYTQTAEIAHPNTSLYAIDTDYVENSYYAQADMISNIIQNNKLLVGIKYESANTIKSEWSIDSVDVAPISSPDLTRDILSTYINDTYTLSQKTDISAGLRYDNYSDSGDCFSPTVGLVYRAIDTLKLKLLYAHAFRAPSWIELTSNSNLKAESSNSIEAGVVYKVGSRHIMRLNFYHTDLDNMITKEDNTYVQSNNTKFNGTEFEYIYSYDEKLDFNFLASYIDAKDSEDKDLPDVANTIISTSAVYDFDNGLSFGSLLKYVSSSKRSDTDERGDFPSSVIFDESITYQYKDFSISLIIKDLFDQATYYAMPQDRDEDFYESGRSILAKISMDF